MNTINDFFKSKMDKRLAVAFFSTLIIGFIAHSFIYYNKISIFDDISSINGFSGNWLFALGRYTQGLIKIFNDKLFGSYSNSFLNGILSLFIISLINIIIVKVLDIKKTITIVLISAVITTSTGLLCLYAYMYVAVFYTLAILLSILSTYIYIYGKFVNDALRIVATALLIFFSITIYQSYFLFGVILYLYYIMNSALNSKISLKKIIQYVLSVLIAILFVKFANVIFFSLYNFVDDKLSLAYDSLSLTTYQGIRGTSFFQILNPESLYAVISHIFIGDDILFGKNIYIYYIFMILAVFFIVKSCISKKYTLAIKISLVLTTALIYLCSNSLYILSDKTHLYTLPLFPKCMIFLFPAILYECFDLKKIFKYIILIFFTYFIMYNVVLSNSTYLNRFMRQSAEISWCERLATRIENTVGYNDDYDVYCYGKTKGWDIFKNDNKFNESDLIIESISPWNYSSINQYNFSRYMEYFTGFKSLSFKYNQFHGNESIIDGMHCYPDDDSIRVVDNKIYIKFSELLE